MFSSEEKLKISSKDLNNIEKDMLGEAFKSENKHTENTSKNSNENLGNNDFGGASQINTAVPIPKEIPKVVLGGVTYLVYEKRIQALPSENQKEARSIVAPTDKQVDVMGNILTWASDRYGVNLFESPFFAPAMMVLELGRIELVKWQTFKHVQEISKDGENE